MSGRIIRYRPGVDPKPEDRTDWERVDRMTDDEVEAAALSDPDARPTTEVELRQGHGPGEIVAIRKRLGLSQAAFARRFHSNLRTLQDWEQGRRAPEETARAI